MYPVMIKILFIVNCDDRPAEYGRSRGATWTKVDKIKTPEPGIVSADIGENKLTRKEIIYKEAGI